MENVIIGTGSYDSVLSGNTVSITGDGGNAWGYYEIRLKDLNVNKLLNELFEKFGNNIILLCHGDVDDFCHRRVLADYIELETGIYIPEVSVDDNGIIKKLEPIRYKNRLKDVIKSRK